MKSDEEGDYGLLFSIWPYWDKFQEYKYYLKPFFLFQRYTCVFV